MFSEAGYEAVLDILAEKVADYVESHPELREQPTEDMWSFRNADEDVDDDEEDEEDWCEEDDEEPDWF